MQPNNPDLYLIACTRSGHRAVLRWLYDMLGYMPADIEQKPFSESVCTPGLPILLVRDFPNWLASIVSWRGFPDPEREMVEFINGYVDTYITHLENAFSVPTILYPDWVRAGYGESIKLRTQSRFKDGHVLHRYEQMGGSAIYHQILAARTDAVLLSKQVFESGGPTADRRVGVLGPTLQAPSMESDDGEHQGAVSTG